MAIGSTFKALEEDVMVAICEIYVDYREALDAQLTSAALAGRENTGAGCYTYFEVKRTVPPIVEQSPLVGPEARIDGLKHGMGFILWLENGYAKCLEGYSYDESTIGVDFEQISFKITES